MATPKGAADFAAIYFSKYFHTFGLITVNKLAIFINQLEKRWLQHFFSFFGEGFINFNPAYHSLLRFVLPHHHCFHIYKFADSNNR